ncbi:MAG: hypothetical protein ACLVBP_16185 [Ruminococcus sp.]
MAFKQIASSVFKFLQDNVFKPLDDFIENVFATDWSKHFGVLGGVLNGFFKSGQDTIRDIRKVFEGFNEFISGVFSGDWEKAWNGINDIFVGVFNGLADIAKTPINAIIGGFNSVLGLVNGLINKVNNIRFKITVPDWIPGIGGSWWGFNGFNIPTIGTIPMLANGGFVKANTPQLAMIGDNRHQGEIVSPEDKLQEMALKAAALAAGGANDAELLTVLETDPGVFAEYADCCVGSRITKKIFYPKNQPEHKSNRKTRTACVRRHYGKENIVVGEHGAPSPVSISVNDQIIWSANTGRSASGSMIGDVVAEKKDVAIKWGILTEAELAAIKRLWLQAFFLSLFMMMG